MKNEEQKLYQIGEYVRICRKKRRVQSGKNWRKGVDVSKDDDLQKSKNGEKCHEYPAVFSDRQFSGYFGKKEVIRLFRKL